MRKTRLIWSGTGELQPVFDIQRSQTTGTADLTDFTMNWAIYNSRYAELAWGRAPRSPLAYSSIVTGRIGSFLTPLDDLWWRIEGGDIGLGFSPSPPDLAWQAIGKPAEAGYPRGADAVSLLRTLLEAMVHAVLPLTEPAKLRAYVEGAGPRPGDPIAGPPLGHFNSARLGPTGMLDEVLDGLGSNPGSNAAQK